MKSRGIRRVALVAVASAVALGLSGCSSTLNDAANITFHNSNGSTTTEHITRADFQRDLSDLLASAQFRKLLVSNGVTTVSTDSVDSRASAVWLGYLLTQAAVDREFNARHLKITADDVRAAQNELSSNNPSASPLLPVLIFGDVYESLSTGLKQRVAEGRARADAVVKYYSNPTPAMERTFYDENLNTIACRRVSHILLHTEAEADAVLARLRSGAKFADEARRNSTDTGSASKGGDLGCMSSNEFVPAFQAAAEKAPLNTVVGPVHTQFGYHLIYVTTETPTFNQVESTIRSRLPTGIAVQLALKDATVHIDPRYGKGVGPQALQGSNVYAYQVASPDAPQPRNHREQSVADVTTTVPGG